MFNKEQLQRFSIRKLTVGAASVLIGVSLMTEMSNNKVYADVRTTNENSNSQVHDNSDGNTLNLSTDLKNKADEAGTADSEVTNNSNAKVGGDSVTDNSNARNVEIKNIDDSKKDQQSGDAVAPKEKTANTIQKHEENVAKGTTVDSNDLQVAKAQADLAATKINGKASSVVSPQIKQIQAKYQISKNLPLEKQINPTDKNSDGKVVVKAEDPSNYPSELNNLIGEDKYIYQVLSLDNDPDTKLILSVNRNDSTDTNIYAYVDNNGKIEPVVDNNGKIEPVTTVGENQKEIIKINKRGYQINNDGSSNINIGDNKESTQNSSTVTSARGYYTSEEDIFGFYYPKYHTYSNVNPIKQSYGLGNTSNDNCSAIGEIVPVFTKNSVIKYYYLDNEKHLQEFKNLELPNVSVEGFTGQEFEIDDVGQYEKVIQGYHLTSAPKGNFKGTLSQFTDDKYYKKVYYDFGTNKVKYSVLYHQIYPDGTMEVWLVDGKGDALTEPREIAPNTSTEFSNYNCTVRNPYVTAVQHEVQFIYSPNAQTAKITYIDDTTKTNLESKDASGKFGQAITFETAPADEIANYKKQGYVLVSNSFDNNKYQADDNNNVFYVHLKHDTKKVSRNDDVNMTVHYVMDDDSVAPSDNKQTVSFTEDGIQDLVTQKITWTPADSQTLKDVDSPVLTGYTADIKTVNGKAVNFGDPDINVTVHYNANAQTAKITYIDDTTKNTLDSKDASGKFGQAITFATAPTDEIANYKKQGYVLVSNSFNNQTYAADNNNNVFYVHLKHKIENVTRNDTVTRTIHYLYDNGNTAQPDKTQTVSFNETGTKDDVTGETTWNNDNAQTIDRVITPSITGYTPDKSSIEKQSFKFGDKDVEVTVRYSANEQTATITYIDDTDKKTLGSDSQNGKFNQAITFATAPAAKIANYKEQGYVLVSNSFNNNKYQADNSKNVFYVHLKHKIENVTRNDTVTRTIHYLYDNGNTAQPDKTQTVSFDETGTKDDVTNKTTWSNDNAQTVDSVITPSITGYTPDKSSIEKQSFKFGDQDVEVTVTYNANAQTAKITYIDDTTKNNLDSKDASGKFGQAITFATAPSDEIANYKKQGYVLVSNSFNNQTYAADNNNNVFYVHLKHGTKKVSRNDDVNMTVHYVMDDDSVAPSDSKQTVNFTEDGTQDLVTQKITWTPADSQTLNDVASPVLTGYTADIKTAKGKVVNFGDQDVEVTVTYHANAQTAKITYIDDTTKNTLDSKDANGKFGQAITFATAPSDEIANYKKQGYVLVSNSFDNNKYQADNSNNVFYVHLKHDTKTVSRNDDVNMTVHYVMDDNSEAPSDNKQTVNFTEDGIQDNVTGNITWTPAESQTLKDVASPVLTGYTADIKTVNGKAVNFGDPDINVTVHYSANAQTAKITYIDDTDKNTLDSKDANGKFGQAITFATAPSDEIANYKKQGYVLVSNSFDNNKYQADNNNNVFYVHLKHDTKKVSRNDDVNMTVHYVMDDDSVAPNDNKQTVNFTEDGIQDLVTQKITWTPADSQTLNDVASPVLTGYTADIKTANGKAVNFGDPDINVTVHYSANAQTATITYIDDTDKKTLGSDSQNGKFNQAITFEHDPAAKIANYKKQGYVLVSNSFNNNKYQADDNNNVFYVHLKHGTKTVNREHSASFTVHYIYKDGGQAKPDHEQTLSFTENGIQDLVTQKITWTPADGQKFDDVATPVITGYTPDHDKVIGQTANFETDNREVTVTYLPNVQLGHINYIDDNTGKTLTRDNFSGRTNEHEDYTPNDRIQEFENKGYVFVSSDYPDGGFNFDDNDQQDQVFNVHLKHGIVTVTTKKPQTPNMPIDPDPHSPKYPKDISNTNSDVKRTIDYKFKDGKTAQPTVNDSLHFERTVVIDKVTGDVLSDIWTPSQDFNDVQTSSIQGYTPDRTVVSDKNIGHDHQNIVEHVIYNPDAQHMTITYVDDTTGKELHTDKLNGVSDQDAKYTTGDMIKRYEDQHYKMTIDPTNGQDLIFDHDDNTDQTYKVHFVHGSHTINQTTSPKQTVHYVYADDLARHGKAADDNVQQLSFTRDGYNDEVTGIDHWNAWTPANSQYKAVDSPVVQGYTPDKSVIEKSTVNPADKDTEITVVYNADKQAAHVIYVDKTTNDVLTSNNLSGKSDKDSGYNTKDTIGKYQSQHYVLTGDETDGKNVIFDHDDKQNQTYYVYFVHGTQKVNRQDTVTSTIDYKFEDGKTAQPTVTQTKHFSEDGVKDLVTGKIVWDEAESQKFDDIATKSIAGYTPDKDNVTGSTVNFGDSDIEVTVTYHNNAQKAVITYVDDVTKKTLASDSQDGKFDHEITFEHDPAEVINSLKEKGYKLVSNDFKDGTKYKADDKQNEFIVHLTHDKQKVNRQDQVIETIHYVYENGSKSQPDHEQTISFTEDGIKDKVTGQIAWTSATPQKFDDVATPAISGYTPDKGNVTGSTVKFGDKDIEVTVTYHNNAQTAKITYVDDVTKKTLASDSQDGKFDHEITFEHDPAEVIKGLEEKGYKLVSDNFKPGIKYQNDNKLNIFEVHLVHTYEPVETSQTITETVHYIDANGKPVAPDHVAKVVIKVTGTRDKVTDSIIWNTPSTGHFDEVISPEVPNMTPDKKLIPGRDVQYGDSDITESVVYTPDNSTSKTPEKPDKPSKEVSKTPEKPNKPSKEVSKIPEKPNKSSKEVSKAPEKSIDSQKSIDSRTVDNHVSAKSTAKRELPQTSATINTGIWTGLVSMIASLGLLGASKKRKKN